MLAQRDQGVTFGSVCAGAGGMDLGFVRAGFSPLWQIEIDPACQSVLRHHFPDAALHSDLREHETYELEKPDVIIGGTPCQGFSFAGERRSLEDDRSNLCLQFVRLCDRIGPDFIVWENVPGVLSADDNAFGCFLGALVGHENALVHPDGMFPQFGQNWPDAGLVVGPRRAAAWRVLDSQYFGVAQRRQRVFVVAHPVALGRSMGAAEFQDQGELFPLAGQILFEPESLRRNVMPSREKRQEVAPTLDARAGSNGCHTFNMSGGLVPEIAGTLGSISGGQRTDLDGMTYIPEIPEAFGCNNQTRALPVAGALTAHSSPRLDFETDTLLVDQLRVRRLTPVECERLQGWPDDHTLAAITVDGKLIEQKDSPRYRQIGNGVTAPVAQWLAGRILNESDTLN
jgi:DNA (cytosine-5)-methyltransferase 1